MEPIILSNNVSVPPIIMSTNWMDYPTMRNVVNAGLKLGYRAFDTARDYGNEHIVGRVIEECLKENGLDRKDVFITTKIGNSQQAKGNIESEIDISLNNLRTDYVDAWLMHWPYPEFYIDTYKKMEKIYNNTCKVRSIGMANFHVRHFEKLYASGIEVEPHIVQFEHHPLRTADDIWSFCNAHQIKVQAYSPLCRMIKQVRENEVLHSLAKKYGKSVGQIVLRWHIQHKSIPCFKSLKPSRLKENLDIWDFSLSEEEMLLINSLDQDYKYHLESASCPGF